MRTFYIEYVIMGRLYIEYVEAYSSVKALLHLSKIHKAYKLTVKTIKVFRK